MLWVADTSGINLAARLEQQSPRDIVTAARQLLHASNQDLEWRTHALLELATLQLLIQQERLWLNAVSEPKMKRQMNELINDTMTCLLSLEFAIPPEPESPLIRSIDPTKKSRLPEPRNADK